MHVTFSKLITPDRLTQLLKQYCPTLANPSPPTIFVSQLQLENILSPNCISESGKTIVFIFVSYANNPSTIT